MADITAEELVRKRDALKKSLTALEHEAAVAKADVARLQGELTNTLKELGTYGCSSYEEAVAKRDALLVELSEGLTELEGRIDAIRR